jgi:hypothetical protein
MHQHYGIFAAVTDNSFDLGLQAESGANADTTLLLTTAKTTTTTNRVSRHNVRIMNFILLSHYILFSMNSSTPTMLWLILTPQTESGTAATAALL